MPCINLSPASIYNLNCQITHIQWSLPHTQAFCPRFEMSLWHRISHAKSSQLGVLPIFSKAAGQIWNKIPGYKATQTSFPGRVGMRLKTTTKA